MNNPTPPKRAGNRSRQFSDTGTRQQTIFDVIVGAIIPILLLIFDPAVFRATQSGFSSGSFFGEFAVFAYLAIGFGILVLMSWLVAGKFFKRYATAFIAGILLAGGFFAAILGLVLIPFSLLGLTQLVGVLGFFPFFTSVVYFRNGTRAWRTVNLQSGSWLLITLSLVAGMVFPIGVPALAQVTIWNSIHQSVATILTTPNESDQTIISDLTTLNRSCLGVCSPMIVWELNSYITNHDQCSRFENIYQQATGNDLTFSNCFNSE